MKDINDWVSDKTDKMIPEILETIPDEAVMYLANALAFDAEWAEKYFDYQVYDDDFTTSDGRKETKKYLHGKENIYIEDENATGFMKYYKGYKYAFVALLPNEGIDVDSYLDKVDGAHLSDMLENKRTCAVYTSIPKFNIDYGVEMKEILKEMGMSLAFNSGTADFSKLGHSTGGNIFINGVKHKTFIAVDENGTKAGAATMVEMTAAAAPVMEEPKEVYLTRPFVYMLIDCQTNSPFFIGVMRDLEG